MANDHGVDGANNKPEKHCTAMKNQTSCYLAVLLLLTGCATTFDKAGPSDADLKRDLKMAKAYAKAEAEKVEFSYGGFSIPAIIGSYLIWKPIDKALLRKKLFNERMKTLGWEKESNGKYTRTKSDSACVESPERPGDEGGTEALR